MSLELFLQVFLVSSHNLLLQVQEGLLLELLASKRLGMVALKVLGYVQLVFQAGSWHSLLSAAGVLQVADVEGSPL